MIASIPIPTPASALPMHVEGNDSGAKNGWRPYDYGEIEHVIYRMNDTVVVAGYITADNPPVIKIMNPKGAVYRIDTINVDDDGFFVHEFKLGGKLAVPGKYSVTISYNRSFTSGTIEENQKTLHGKFILVGDITAKTKSSAGSNNSNTTTAATAPAPTKSKK
jgi:hypothetical protein